MAVPTIDTGGMTTVDGDTAATSVTINKPSTLNSGDLAVIIVLTDDANATPSGRIDALTGFTQQLLYGDGDSDTKCAVYTRIATGSEGSSETIGFAASFEHVAWYMRITGHHATTFWNVAGTPNTAVADSSLVIDEVTTTAADCLGFYIASGDFSDTGPHSVSGTGWGEVGDVQSGAAGQGLSASFGTKSVSAAGLTGDATVTFNDTNGLMGIQFAIAPSVDSISITVPTGPWR